MATHEVLNQPPPLAGYNVFERDTALVEVAARGEAGWAREGLASLGCRAGGEEAIEWGRLANVNPPLLRTHDRYGNRIDEVEYHPAYHELMRVALGHGLHAAPWADAAAGRARRPGSGVLRVVAGRSGPRVPDLDDVLGRCRRCAPCPSWPPRGSPACCRPPTTRRAAARHREDRRNVRDGDDGEARWLRRARQHDARARRSSATGPGHPYLLTGHKWFCSAPMSDVFLVLAQAPGGLSCFLVPRWLPDGTRNRLHLQRLKDKLGNRSNASSEIELAGAWAAMIGEEGRGVRTIIEMVNHTRLDCVIGAAATMRQAVAQATHHARAPRPPSARCSSTNR